MTKRTPDRTSSAVHVKPKPIESVQTEKSGQALLFSPSELRACGLRDAHTHPLVGKRTAAGLGVAASRVEPHGQQLRGHRV